MSRPKRYIVVSRAAPRPPTSELAHARSSGPFQESLVKRDGRGQFATKSGTKARETADQELLGLADSRIQDQNLLTSIRDSVRKIMDQHMRMQHIENQRKSNGKTGYYDRDELDYVKSGRVSPTL
jgi:hypothetical protein